MSRTFVISAFYFLWISPVIGQGISVVEPDSRWSLAAVGDVIINRQISPFDQPGDPAFHDLANLVRSADVAFLNLE